MASLKRIRLFCIVLTWNLCFAYHLPGQQGQQFHNQHLGHLGNGDIITIYEIVNFPKTQRPRHQADNYFSNSNSNSLRPLLNNNSKLSPKDINDFEYVPTAQGYRYSYVLNDGSSNGANVVTNDAILPSVQYAGVDAKNTDFNAVGIGGRKKIRKLSPKSLQSLAG